MIVGVGVGVAVGVSVGVGVIVGVSVGAGVTVGVSVGVSVGVGVIVGVSVIVAVAVGVGVCGVYVTKIYTCVHLNALDSGCFIHIPTSRSSISSQVHAAPVYGFIFW